jgi:hypothetical protein
VAQTAEANALTQQQRNTICKNRRRFKRESEAITWVARRRHFEGAKAGRVYRCPVCPGYHVAPPGPLLS